MHYFFMIQIFFLGNNLFFSSDPFNNNITILESKIMYFYLRSNFHGRTALTTKQSKKAILWNVLGQQIEVALLCLRHNHSCFPQSEKWETTLFLLLCSVIAFAHSVSPTCRWDTQANGGEKKIICWDKKIRVNVEGLDKMWQIRESSIKDNFGGV